VKVGFAGAGNMAGAMARGWAAGEGGPDAMLFCDLDRERAESLADAVGGETRDSLGELATDCDLVVLAVKPAALDDVAKELDPKPAAVLSVMAATPVARLKQAIPDVPIARVMPNQPVEVRRGVLCLVAPDQMSAELKARLVELLARLGKLVIVEERLIDAAMAVMSCSPAYLALVAEALTDAGVEEGLDPDLASELVVGTLGGTAQLLEVREPQAIRAAVAPPGGATEAGLEALERGGLSEALGDAVRASLERFR
jgi:pyrroline-5-carboxylate reductase